MSMHEISCPHCNKAFQIDEAGYASILKQVRDEAFESVLANLQLTIDEVKYKQLIYDQNNGIDNRIAIFGNNGTTIKQVDPPA